MADHPEQDKPLFGEDIAILTVDKINEKHLAIMIARMQSYGEEATKALGKQDFIAAAMANAKSKAIGTLINEIWKG